MADTDLNGAPTASGGNGRASRLTPLSVMGLAALLGTGDQWR